MLGNVRQTKTISSLVKKPWWQLRSPTVLSEPPMTAWQRMANMGNPGDRTDSPDLRQSFTVWSHPTAIAAGYLQPNITFICLTQMMPTSSTNSFKSQAIITTQAVSHSYCQAPSFE